MAREIIDRKIYCVEIWRAGQLIGDLAPLCRELSWVVHRNPKVGFGTISFKVDRASFVRWCKERSATADEITRPMRTECVVRVAHNSNRKPVIVACGYLYDAPKLEINTDTYDYAFEFLSLEHKLTLLPPVANGTVFHQLPADDVVRDLITESVNSRAGARELAFDFRAVDKLPKIDRSYNDWKPVSEAVSDMLDNITGAGKFDVWVEWPRTFCIAKNRGLDTKSKTAAANVFAYPYTYNVSTSTRIIPLESSPNYAERDEFATAATLVGAGQGDAAVSVYVEDLAAIAKYGYSHVFKQFSSVTRADTLRQKGNDLIAKSTAAEDVTETSTNGVFLDWGKLSVGGLARIENYEIGSVSGYARIDTIETNCDGNYNESVKLTLSNFDASGWTVTDAR